MKRFALDRGGLLAIAVLALYVALAPHVIVDIDNAEFSTLGKFGGLAHPSGYPLYVLWLRLWSWLPGSPAHAAALATAVIAALQILVLQAACRAWGARPAAATVAVAIYAVAPLVMRYATEAEVFALNGLAVATVLWLAAAAGPLRGHWRIAALALAAGLGMANNLTCVLVAPVGLLGAVRGLRETRWPNAAVAAVLGLAVGLSPYLYAFGAPENLLSPQPVHELADLVDLVLRRQYGGALGFMSGEGVPYGAHLAALLASVGRSWLWGIAPIGVLVLGYRIARPSDESQDRLAMPGQLAGESRAGWIALAASLLLAGPLLATRFDVPTDNVGLYIVRRFHLLPVLLLALPVAAALELAARRLKATIAAALAAAIIAVAAIAAVPEVARFHGPALDDAARTMLGALPPHAVVFGVTDEYDVAWRYLQLAEGMRPDVTYLRPDGEAWYRARFAELPGSPLALAQRVLAEGRPLLVPLASALIAAFPHHVHGVFMRLLPPGTTPPPLDEVVATNRALFAPLVEPAAGPADEVATVIHIHYARAWNAIGDALAAAGRADDASRAYGVASELGPH